MLKTVGSVTSALYPVLCILIIEIVGNLSDDYEDSDEA
jgi:hypothetical protein